MDPASVNSSWESADKTFENRLRSLQSHKQFYAMRGNYLVAVDDFALTGNHLFALRKRVDCIELAFIHSASGEVSFTAAGTSHTTEITPGYRTIFPENDRRYEIETMFAVGPEHPIRIVTIYISRAILAALLGGAPHRLPPHLTFDPTCFAAAGRAFLDPMTPSTASVVHQILNCGLKGLARHLFIESKALELLALEIGGADGRGAGPAFRPEEIKQLHRARQVMMERMLDPPTLRELGKTVGLNEKKIKTGFRTLFGETVYGFLNAHRMETARRLMETRRLGVSEAAWSVGYVNVSHFSAAFRKRFGVLPGAYLRGLNNTPPND